MNVVVNINEAVFIPKEILLKANIYTENISDCVYWHIKGESGDMFVHFSVKSDKDKLKKLIEKYFSGQNIEIETFGGMPNGRIIPRKKTLLTIVTGEIDPNTNKIKSLQHELDTTLIPMIQ